MADEENGKNEESVEDNTSENGTTEVKVENNSTKIAEYDVSTIQALNPSMRRLRTSVVDDHQMELDYEEEFDEDLNVSKAPEDSEEKAESNSNGQEKKDDETKENAAEETEIKTQQSKDEGEAEEDGEAHSTDGELVDEEDCEEGEIKEAGLKKPFVRPMCRFYTRGQCTWGNNCRFLHPGINDKGNYSMIDPNYPMGPPLPNRTMGPRLSESEREPPPAAAAAAPAPPAPPAAAPATTTPAATATAASAPADKEEPKVTKSAAAAAAGTTSKEVKEESSKSAENAPADPESETAWERGMRHAKEIRKRKHRKGTTADKTEDGEKKSESETKPESDRPAQFTRHIPPPPRDPYYDDMAKPGYDADDYYSRLPAPPGAPAGPHDPWGPPPPYGDPYYMQWPPRDYPPEYGMPLPPPPDFRMMERDRMGYGRRLSPPPRFDYRRGPLPPGQDPYYGRPGDAWRDPWMRTKSPRRRRYSSSRSGSRSGSYTSSSSSYTSRSGSRSSSYSSYTGSSGSSYTYSSRSSSGSRSPAPVSKKKKGCKAAGAAGQKQKQGAGGGQSKSGPGMAGAQLPTSPPMKMASSLAGSMDLSSLPNKQVLSQAVAANAADKAAGMPGKMGSFGSKPMVVPTARTLSTVGKGAAAAFAPELPAPPRPSPAENAGFPRVSDLTRLPGVGRGKPGEMGKDGSVGSDAGGPPLPGDSKGGRDSARRRGGSKSRSRSSSRSFSRSRSSSRSDSRSSYTPPSRRGSRRRSVGARKNKRRSSSGSSRSRSSGSDKQYGDMASPISSASSDGGKSPSRPAATEKSASTNKPTDNLRGRSERGDPTQALKNLEQQRRAAMRGGMGHPPHHRIRGEMYPPMPPGARMDHRAMRGMHHRDMRGGRPPLPPMNYQHRGPDGRGGPPMDMRHPRGDMRMYHHREHPRDGMRDHRERPEGRISPRRPPLPEGQPPPEAQDRRPPSVGPREEISPPPRVEKEGMREHHHPRGGMERQQGVATDRRDIRQGRSEGGGERPRRVSTGERVGREPRPPGSSRPDGRPSSRPDKGGVGPLSPSANRKRPPGPDFNLSPTSAAKQARHAEARAEGAGGRTSSRQAAAGVGKSPGKPAVPGASATASRKKSSTSSRREELLMQLKAVEDAIAKKRGGGPNDKPVKASMKVD